MVEHLPYVCEAQESTPITTKEKEKYPSKHFSFRESGRLVPFSWTLWLLFSVLSSFSFYCSWKALIGKHSVLVSLDLDFTGHCWHSLGVCLSFRELHSVFLTSTCVESCDNCWIESRFSMIILWTVCWGASQYAWYEDTSYRSQQFSCVLKGLGVYWLVFVCFCFSSLDFEHFYVT